MLRHDLSNLRIVNHLILILLHQKLLLTVTMLRQQGTDLGHLGEGSAVDIGHNIILVSGRLLGFLAIAKHL